MHLELVRENSSHVLSLVFTGHDTSYSVTSIHFVYSSTLSTPSYLPFSVQWFLTLHFVLSSYVKYPRNVDKEISNTF